MEIQSILQQARLFSTLEKNLLRELAENIHPIHLSEGQVLFQENDIGACFYMIVEGRLKVVKAMGTAEERLLQEFGPGDFLGEMSMFDPDSLFVRDDNLRYTGL